MDCQGHRNVLEYLGQDGTIPAALWELTFQEWHERGQVAIGGVRNILDSVAPLGTPLNTSLASYYHYHPDNVPSYTEGTQFDTATSHQYQNAFHKQDIDGYGNSLNTGS